MITKSKFVSMNGARVCDPQQYRHFERVQLDLSVLNISPFCGSQSRAPVRGLNAGILRAILTLLMTATLPMLAQTTPQDFPAVAQFELGDSGFSPGDSITIQELRGTSDIIQLGGTYCVTGTYTLASHDKADLCLYATTTNRSPTPTDPAQCMHLTKGSGSFRLIKKMNEEGYLHLTFYSYGHGIGGVYFGQGQWVLHNAHYDFTGASSQSGQAATSAPVSSTGPNRALFDYLGNPVPAPPDMNPAYSKEGLMQAMQAAAQAAGISLVKLEIDDSEFPFLVGVTFAKEGDKDKLKEQIFANAAYASSGGVGGEIDYAMNIVPYRAFPETISQRIHHRMLLREAVLYDKITAAQ
jgi:hypothetical protein